MSIALHNITASIQAKDHRKHTNIWFYIDMTDTKFEDITEYSIFDIVMPNQCLIHETENDFIWTPKCHKDNDMSINVVHLENNQFYEHKCASSMQNLSQKYVVKENIVQELDDENRDNGVNY